MMRSPLNPLLMTEQQLETLYLGKVITVTFPGGSEATGKVERIALWQGSVIFMFSDMKRHELDLDYFTEENIEVHGNRPGGPDDGIFFRV